MDVISWVVVGIVVLLVLFGVMTYNRLVRAKAQVDESYSGIDVQLKRRASLIPNLVETVKGYAAHEREVFEKVTEARSALMSAKSPVQSAEANNVLTGALKSLFAVAEAYPDLKASQNFQELQGEISDTETKVAYARQFYNTNVMNYNVAVRTFPTVVVANFLGYHPAEFFQAENEAKQDVKVDFTTTPPSVPATTESSTPTPPQLEKK
jgi:LemA protein